MSSHGRIPPPLTNGRSEGSEKEIRFWSLAAPSWLFSTRVRRTNSRWLWWKKEKDRLKIFWAGLAREDSSQLTGCESLREVAVLFVFRDCSRLIRNQRKNGNVPSCFLWFHRHFFCWVNVFPDLVSALVKSSQYISCNVFCWVNLSLNNILQISFSELYILYFFKPYFITSHQGCIRE